MTTNSNGLSTDIHVPAILIKPCGDIDEITLNTTCLRSNFETEGYCGEFRLLYTWRMNTKIVEMYGYIDGSIENFEELPEHEQQFESYFGDVLLLSKDLNDIYITFNFVDYIRMLV